MSETIRLYNCKNPSCFTLNGTSFNMWWVFKQQTFFLSCNWNYCNHTLVIDQVLTALFLLSEWTTSSSLLSLPQGKRLATVWKRRKSWCSMKMRCVKSNSSTLCTMIPKNNLFSMFDIIVTRGYKNSGILLVLNMTFEFFNQMRITLGITERIIWKET